jgi:drug/metabolite transporter (DMT)-like permease
MLLAVVFYASSLILIKVINIVEPGISSFNMLAIRSAMNILLLLPVVCT